MKQLPIEIQRYILEFIPINNCTFCNKQMVKLKYKFCNNTCLRNYNIYTWGDLIYMRNGIGFFVFCLTPVIDLSYIKHNIPHLTYIWCCGISFIILLFYMEYYFMNL